MTSVSVTQPTKFEVFDNVLPEDSFKELQHRLLTPDFPWYFNLGVSTPNYSLENALDFQFTHTFYNNYSPTSPHIESLSPLISYINPSAIVRIKANLNPISPKQIESGYHVDFDFVCKTAVFYLTTNNGYTKFKTGEIIESVENRLLVFDSQSLHTGSTCTDTSIRAVINLNYFK